jgi:putative membrane protein
MVRSIPKVQRNLILGVAVLLALAQINQPYPEVALLQHSPTFLLLIASPWLLRRWPMSNAAVFAVAVFLALHTLGGRYTYSNVPYDEWSRAIAGQSISATFGWTRNHYDRLVHLAFGVFMVLPIADFLVRHRAHSWRFALWQGLLWVLALSCVYEILEWVLTLIAAGSTADDYNGQQGDIWDAQKDMALAGGGALLSALWLLRRVPPTNEKGS